MTKISHEVHRLDANYFLALRAFRVGRQAGLSKVDLEELLGHVRCAEEALVEVGHRPGHTLGALAFREGSPAKSLSLVFEEKHFPPPIWGARRVDRVGSSHLHYRKCLEWGYWKRVVPTWLTFAEEHGHPAPQGASVPEGLQEDLRYALILRAWMVCRQSGLPRLAALEAHLGALEAEWIEARRPPVFTLNLLLGPNSPRPSLRLAHLMAKHFPEDPWGQRGLAVLTEAHLAVRAEVGRWALRMRRAMEAGADGEP